MAVTPTTDNPNGWGSDERLLKEWKYSSNLILRPGDSIRMKEGPYFVKQDGTKSSMAFRGNAVIVRIEAPGDHMLVPGVILHVQEITRAGVRWAYHACRITGPTVIAVSNGITSHPYKVTKARRPHVVHDMQFSKAT